MRANNASVKNALTYIVCTIYLIWTHKRRTLSETAAYDSRNSVI